MAAELDRQDLFYPDLQVEIGSYIFTEGISVKTYSCRNKSYDWGKVIFTNEYKPEISLPEQSEIVIKLGYSGVLQEVFIGTLIKGYDKCSDMNEILFKDHMYKLEKANITACFKNCTPQDIIKEGLMIAGIEKYHLSQNTYPVKKMFPVYSKNMVQLLKQINAAWGIENEGFFIKGRFYWGTAPTQEEIPEFEYGSNIISLGRGMDMWELVTISIPSMQHSQKIAVNHPKITGVFETEKVVFATNEAGFLRTTIYFKGE